MNTLTTYLTKYYKIQSKILLCYRPTDKIGWRDRCFYLDEKYNACTPYNHRSILDNEVIIEYDNNDKEVNRTLTKEVCKRLDKDDIKYSLWDSGNRSLHIHLFLDFKGATNIPLIKKTFIRHYCKDLDQPDLRLCSGNHLIRAEYGVNEKSGKPKTPIYRSLTYPHINEIKPKIWDEYSDERRKALARSIVRNDIELTSTKGFKYIVAAAEFKEAEDGRERALFMLIHLLKPQYKDNKKGLIEFLQDWYRYSGGFKLTGKQIEFKVYYHWERQYNFTENYLNELLTSINRSDLIENK
jgi:hypothetical protein